MKDEAVQNIPAAVVTANPPDVAMVGPTHHALPTLGASASWLFIPMLYVMQGMPVTTVQEMFPVTFKDLNVANPVIVFWTSIIALPWTLKLFWAPLIDLNSTKRRWTVAMEVLIGLMFAALAGCVLLPQYASGVQQAGFIITLIVLSLMAIFSSTHDIACDGLYILALNDERRAAYVGLQGSCYKLGRLLCVGGLVWLAGEINDLQYELQSHPEKLAKYPKLVWVLQKMNEFLPAPPKQGWVTALALALLIYGCGTIYNFFVLPKPAIDRPAMQSQPGENRRDILRTTLVLVLGVGIYLLLSGGIRLIGGGIFVLANQHRDLSHLVLAPWQQTGVDMRELVMMFVIGAIIFAISCAMIRPAIGGTPMAEAFMSFVRLPRFWAIMLFIMFYRFGEAMVTRVLPLFLKDPIAIGGLGVSTRDVGGIVGMAGVIGIICGGIVGGILVSRWGLRKAFWPLAIAMYAPNIFYLFIAIIHQQFADPHSWPNAIFHYWILYAAAFVHEFGYGIGFATYCLFLMNISQRGKFKAAHYAFGTGLGALCITMAGIVSAILLTVVNYVWFFAAVCLLSIPGMITLLLIPIEE